MGIWDGLAKRFGYVPQDPYTLIPRAVPAKAQPITNPPAFLRADAVAEQYSIPDRSLPEAQLELYQRLSWVQIAVSKIAEVGATTAFNVLSLDGEETNDIPNHPFELLLRRPNPLQSRAEFLEGTLINFALTGNSYWWLNLIAGKPAELWLLPPHKVKPVPDGRQYLRGYLYDTGQGTPIPLELTEVVHFRRFHPLNSFVGLSPIEALAVVATGDMAAQKWNTNFFSKDNAKMSGILGFRDPIPDPDWARMKQDIKSEYGGTQRAMMMLRNVGDGIHWSPTAMSQGDMQFLEGRTFTKEEVFAIYAPGLSSMLAVNATEANSVSGKRTFVEYGVWPHLVRIAEKITNDLLPLYGPGLVGEFDDIRVTDKQMELSEIAAYSQTHTVDEVRAKYYGDDELGDERGNLLVTEVGKGLTPADPEAQALSMEAQRKVLETPTQPTPLQQAQGAQDAQGDAEDDNQGEYTNGVQDTQGQGQGETGRQQEVKALRRWLKNRRNPDPLKFRRVHLSADDVLDIAADMGIDTQEADTVQPPFTMTAIMDGSPTRDDWQTAVKAMVLQLDPGDDDAGERIITELERRGEASILRAFREQWKNLLPPNAEAMELNELMSYVNARLIEQQPAVDAIARTLYDAAGAGVNMALDELERIGIGFDYTLVNTRAQEWAKRYSYELIQGINDTTKQAVQQAVERWYGNGEPLQALIDDLQPAFSKKRARLIAQTETTRAAAEGNRYGYKESGVVTGLVWKTVNDGERVCPICKELDGKIVSIEGGRFYDELPAEIRDKMKRTFEIPPSHPGCILPGNEVVIPGALNAATKSFYNGRCVEITFSDGRKITVTKNHPVLTPQGWIQAQLISEGDYVIGTRQAERIAAGVKPDYNHVPTAIEDVFGALKKSGGVSSITMPAAAENFHGDGRDIHGDINIVFADGFMLGDGQSTISQYVGEHSFDYRAVGDVVLSGNGSLSAQVETLWFTTNGSVGISSHIDSFFIGGHLPTCNHSLAAIAWRDAVLEQAITEGRPTHTSLSREFLLRFASDISTDKVVKVRTFDYLGHVYDLQ